MNVHIPLYTSEKFAKLLETHPRRADFRSRNAFLNAILAGYFQEEFPLRSGKNKTKGDMKEDTIARDFRNKYLTPPKST